MDSENKEIKLTPLHMGIMNFFKNHPKGRGNAVTKEFLTLHFNCSNRRLRHVISELRQLDEPIGALSSDTGYFTPATFKEALSVANEIHRRARETDAGAAVFEKEAAKYKSMGK